MRSLGSLPIITPIMSIVFLALVPLPSALALENIHDVLWAYPSPGLPAGSTTYVELSFEADLTARDLASGLRFSIVETAPGKDPVSLLEYSATDLALPKAGSPVMVYVGFRLKCGAAPDQLLVRHNQGILSLCAESGAAGWRMFTDHQGQQELSVVGWEAFGLAVRDENGQLDSLAPPDLACGTGGSVYTAEQARDEMRRAKSLQLSRLQEGGDSGTLGVYFDAAGTQCQGTVQPGQPGTVYVLAKMNGISECGIGGAEFRFEGVPASWTTYPVPNPAMLAMGDPFGDGVLGVWNCAKPENGAILLYTVLVVATEAEENVEFRLETHRSPASSLFKCPMILLCDFPMFTGLCVETMPCFVNATATRTCEIPLAVENTLWGKVKSLYR